MILMVTVIEYPEEAKEYMDTMLSGKNSIEEIYQAVAPNREITAEITDILKKARTVDVDALDNNYVRALPSTDDQLNSVVDEISIQNKAVSRDVTYFRNTHCYADKINESGVSADWFRNMPKCETERTGNFQQTQYGVRQTHMVYRPYRGDSYLKWYWNDNGSWTLGNSYYVAEGVYKQIRVAGTGIYDIRWINSNAADDGFNYTIHNAVGDINLMKLSKGDDKYQIFCECPANTQLGTPRIQGILEVCMDNTLQWNGPQATTYCFNWGVSKHNVSSCTAPLNRERVTATTLCSNAGGTCWYKVYGVGETGWNSNCLECQHVCP